MGSWSMSDFDVRGLLFHFTIQFLCTSWILIAFQYDLKVHSSQFEHQKVDQRALKRCELDTNGFGVKYQIDLHECHSNGRFAERIERKIECMRPRVCVCSYINLFLIIVIKLSSKAPVQPMFPLNFAHYESDYFDAYGYDDGIKDLIVWHNCDVCVLQ